MKARKKYGQHFLQAAWADRLIEALAPQATDHFLEIGPGPGVLTTRLARRVAHLTAVEIDRDMVAALLPGAPPNVTIVPADILAFDMAALTVASPLRVAGNLPYNLSSPILFRLLAAHRATGRIPDATVMLQREVAERIAAKPGAMSYLSVFVQYHADVRVAFVVPRSAFEPAPEVESAVLSGVVRPRRLALGDEDSLWRLVQAGFRERRKMLHNVLPRQLPEVGRKRFEEALAAAGIAPDRRPQTVSVDEWLALHTALGTIERSEGA